jgi:hypothetical protein
MYFITYQICTEHKRKYTKSINNKIIDAHPIQWLLENKDKEVVLLFWEQIDILEEQRKLFDEATFTYLPNE